MNALTQPVGIICALPEEAISIQTEMAKGHIDASSVGLTLSGMGKVNAAMAAQRLISDYNVRAIVFTGAAGGINPQLAVGDIIIARQTFQHDYGFWGEEFKPHSVGRLPEIGLGTTYKPLLVPLDVHIPNFDALLQALDEARDKFLPVKVDDRLHRPDIHTGVVATGDQFIANSEKKAWLRRFGADAVEMEGAAVAQVALHHGIPMLLVRSISDQADHHSHVDFKSFAAAVSVNHAVIVREVLDFL